MKKICTLFILIVLLTSAVNAQAVVSEDVHFDIYQSSTDNDFVNYFSGGTSLTQIQSSGITGGCLLTSDSIDWGNESSTYCSRYKPDVGDTTVTSICFLYDLSVAQTGTSQRAVTFWLVPQSDFNHYVVASITGDKKIQILTYSWSNSPFPNVGLLHLHWYKFALTSAFLGGPLNHVYLKAEVFDLGFSGTDPPALVTSSDGTINDNILAADTSIYVKISAASRAGAVYLDDFHFGGREGFSNCPVTPAGIANEPVLNSFSIYPSPAQTHFFIQINSGSSENTTVSIYDATGNVRQEIHSMEKKIDLDVSSFPAGMYYVHCSTDTQSWTSKITVSK